MALQKLDKHIDNFPFETEENTDCHTAVQVCKRSEYFLDRSMSGTELNYRYTVFSHGAMYKLNNNNNNNNDNNNNNVSWFIR